MITPKKIIKMAKKWQKLAASKRKRISFPRTTTGAFDAESCSTSSTAGKGHFVVYSADERRFVIPLKYLKNNIIIELFRIAEEEFGLSSSEPIILPCDAIFMEYVVSLIERPGDRRCREGTTHVLDHWSLFTNFISPSRAIQPTITGLQLLKQILD
ncbi:Auxin-responsive protein [Melia azedarach]|uniref:Auxin-responsive protein n=1 Tax=Melia azedarach TaxID=155640 RepID=A0ACC1XWT7_MELAZ|nr:Auxin-responsive protein [Melia azedarach]